MKECDVLLVNHENDRSYKYKGKSYSPFLDSLRVLLEREHRKVECASLFFNEEPSSQSYFEYKTLNRLAIKNQLAGTFKREMPVISDTKTWETVLKRCRPKLVIGIQPSKALNRACHALGIRVYDYQHGVITSSMSYYGAEHNLKRNLAEVPDGFFCWDESSVTVISEWAKAKGLGTIELGNPWLKRFSSISEDDTLVRDELAKLPVSRKKRILVTLQWGLSHFYPSAFNSEDPIHPSLETAIKNSTNVDWLIRLHPNMQRQKSLVDLMKNKFEGIDNVIMEEATNMALPALLSSASGHLTWDSSCVIEASVVKVPSFVLNPAYFVTILPDGKLTTQKDHLPFEREAKLGMVTRSSGNNMTEEILSWVHSLSIKPERNLESLFRENEFLDLVRREIA